MSIPAVILTADRDEAWAVVQNLEDIAVLQKPANAQRIRRSVMELIMQPANARRYAVSSE